MVLDKFIQIKKLHVTCVTLATWVRCYLPKARALQSNDFSFLNFWKSPFQARDMVILPKLVKILWRLPTLSSCSLPSRGATVLGACSMARALHSDGSRFLNFCKTPLQAWETSVWTQMSVFHQFWRNSTDGSPLWMAIARPPEVQLTWVLFLQLENSQLMILGTGSASKVHSKPDLCAFENVVTKSVIYPKSCPFYELLIVIFPQPGQNAFW